MKYKFVQVFIFFHIIFFSLTNGQTIELLSDINPGSSSGWTNGAYVVGNINGKLVFVANDGVHGSELWITDGTAQGTQMIKDCNPGPGSSGAIGSIKFNGVLLLAFSDGMLGGELWQTDGTANGTYLIKDIYAGQNQGISNFKKLFEQNGYIYFIANDGIHGEEIWMTDGSTAGTTILYDINPGINNADLSPYAFYTFNGSLFFSANDGTNGFELWITNGQSSGTHILRELNPGSSSSIDPAGIYFHPCANGFIYQGIDSISGFSMNFTDGTFNGTLELCSMLNGQLGAHDNELIKLNNKWLFSNRSSTYRINEELWATDGTISGTHLLKDIDGDTLVSSMNGLGYLGQDNLNMYFNANDSLHGFEIYKTDGTSSGTNLLKDIYSGTSSCSSEKVVNIYGSLYFSASDSLHGSELWKSDGTTLGTSLLKDINPGVLSGVLFDTLFTNSGFIYFLGTEPGSGTELWRTDGSTIGTSLVSDITSGPLSTINIAPTTLRHFSNSTLVEVTTLAMGSELFLVDFISGNCTLLRDILPGIDNGFLIWLFVPDSADNFTEVKYNNFNLFLGKNSSDNVEIWKTDGTIQNTVQLFDINPGSVGSDPQPIYRMQNKIILKATVDSLGTELFILNLDSLSTNIESYEANTISVFPNPTSSIFTVKNTNNGNSIENISMYNIIGEKVLEFFPNSGINCLQNNEIQINSNQRGIFILKIQTNTKEYIRKIIIQ